MRRTAGGSRAREEYRHGRVGREAPWPVPPGYLSFFSVPSIPYHRQLDTGGESCVSLHPNLRGPHSGHPPESTPVMAGNGNSDPVARTEEDRSRLEPERDFDYISWGEGLGIL